MKSKYFLTLICVCFVSYVNASGRTEISIPVDTGELAYFPYVMECLKKERLQNKEEARKIVRDDKASIKKEGENYKPIKADLIETPLSHLLNWMRLANKKHIKAIGVYSKSGLCIGYSSEDDAMIPIFIDDDRWWQKVYSYKDKPLVEPYSHTGKNDLKVSYPIFEQGDRNEDFIGVVSFVISSQK